MDDENNGQSNGCGITNPSDFLKKARKIHLVQIEAMEASIYVRAMSGIVRAEFGKLYNQLKESGIEEQTRSLVAPLLAKHIVDETGKPIFDDNAVLDFDANVFDQIGEALMRVSGLKQDAIEDAEKNSAPTQSASSSTAGQTAWGEP